MLPETEHGRPRCPAKENQVKLLEAVHEQAMSTYPPAHEIDIYCDFDWGPREVIIPRSRIMARFLGPTRIVEVCCWRPSETPVDFP